MKYNPLVTIVSACLSLVDGTRNSLTEDIEVLERETEDYQLRPNSESDQETIWERDRYELDGEFYGY